MNSARETGGPVPRFPPNLERYLPLAEWQGLIADTPGKRHLKNAYLDLSSLHYLLATYLPVDLVREINRHSAPGLVGGEPLSGTLFFSDVSGFTALSERLANQEGGIELLTSTINDYFAEMLTVLAKSGGILLKFAGDALLAYFSIQEKDKQALWAVRAGWRMMGAMAKFSNIETPEGPPIGLKMKIGIATGDFAAIRAGSRERMEYIILGGTIARTMAAEGVAEAGQVIVDERTAEVFSSSLSSPCAEVHPGFYKVDLDPEEGIDDYEVKAETYSTHRPGSVYGTSAEIIADIKSLYDQIEVLSPYLPAELVNRIIDSKKAGKRRVESEFRPTTTLFFNFTGFEELLSITGDLQRVTDMLSEYFVAMHEIIAQHGGVITRIDPYSRGSKMLVLFGAPVAHEDDPVRGVRTALSMRAKLEALNERWRDALDDDLLSQLQDPPIQQRVGITQGVTFAGQAGDSTRREYTVMGDDVNLAARLMSAAQPGQILISPHVNEAVVDYFRITSLPAIRVKGKSYPIQIYQVDGLLEDRLARRLQSRGPLFGRDVVLEQGRECLEYALEGCGTLLTILGPAGIGKSHLVDVLIDDAPVRGARIFMAECEAYTVESPYTPWITLLKAMVGIRSGDSTQLCGDKLLRLLHDLGLNQHEHVNPLCNLFGLPLFACWESLSRSVKNVEAQSVTPDRREHTRSIFDLEPNAVASTVDGASIWQMIQQRRSAQTGQQVWSHLKERVASRERARLCEAVCQLLERLSAKQPLILLFENAQWLDDASWRLLGDLESWLGSQPILILVVQRCEGTHDAVDGCRVGKSLVLEPLDQDGVRALVEHFFKDVADQVDLALLTGTISEQSRGNPLFIQEIVEGLRRTGQIDLTDLNATLRVSSTLQQLVLGRLDALPNDQRRAVRAASIVGDKFSVGEVRPLLPDDALDVAFAGLEEARWVSPVSADADGASYAFLQTLVRDVIYDSLSFEQRSDLHARFAEAMERRYESTLAHRADLLAYHYEQASKWSPVSVRHSLSAARYLILAGHNSRSRHVYSAAADYYARALSVLEQLPAEEEIPTKAELMAQARVAQGDVAFLAGDFAAAELAYREACVAVSNGDSNEPSRALQPGLVIKLALVLPALGQAEEAEEYASRVDVAHLTENDRLAAAATKAWLLWRDGAADAEDWIQQAAALTSRVADPWGAGIDALLRDMRGEWAEARQAYLDLDLLAGAALTACRLGDRRLEEEEFGEALTLYNWAAEIWEKEGDAYGLALARYRQAAVYWQDLNISDASARLDEAITLLDADDALVQDDRALVQQAQEAVAGGQSEAWAPWRWRHYDDVFRASVLFRP